MMRPTGGIQRVKEGWQFGPDGKGRDFICKVNKGSSSVCINYFKSNEEALEFVTQKAAEGSQFHIDCLKYAMLEKMREL